MRRTWSIAIIGFWVIMVMLLAYRHWPGARPNGGAVDARPAPVVGEEWLGVFHSGAKIGYARHHLTPEGDGFVFGEESLLRLTVSEAPQVVSMRVVGHTGADLALRDVEFELSSGVGKLRAAGRVEGNSLRLTLHAGDEVSEQVLPLAERLYLPTTLRALVPAGGLAPGRVVEALVFDPVSMRNDHLRVRIEGYEAVPQSAAGEKGWRLREEFRDIATTAWIDAAGTVLREEGPMGLVLVRQTPEQALQEGWGADTADDLVAQAAVPVKASIDDARTRVSLRVRLSGIAIDQVPSDDEQTRNGSIVSIHRPAPAELASYELPCAAPEMASDLAATTFLQSDHPRIQTTARAALGGERDAQRAAQRLNDWVYDHLGKVPTVSIPNALQVLEMGEGDCNEHAVLLAALGRAVGLPTRVVAGVVYVDGAFFYHAWCEVWLHRWVSIDPALHQFPADATHIKLINGGPEEHLAMLGIIGRLGVEVLADDGATADAGE